MIRKYGSFLRNNLRKLMAPFFIGCNYIGKENYNVLMKGFRKVENLKFRFIPIAAKNLNRDWLLKKG